jgi:hypothetical protein
MLPAPFDLKLKAFHVQGQNLGCQMRIMLFSDLTFTSIHVVGHKGRAEEIGE